MLIFFAYKETKIKIKRTTGLLSRFIKNEFLMICRLCFLIKDGDELYRIVVIYLAFSSYLTP